MGSIIKEDTEGEPSAALTQTGKGGLFSQGYLRDQPARTYVGEGETAVFVLTDDETGIERERDGEHTSITPGAGFRAITVVTDRRVIVLVGDADDGSDKRVTLPLVELTGAQAEDGILVLTRATGVTWRCHADTNGIEDVAEYVRAAAAAWTDVEATLDDVKRSIVAATAHRDEGAYEDAIDAMGDARDTIEAVQERIDTFGCTWPADAMDDRVERIRDRCLATAAEIRVGHARAMIDDGETDWRAGNYEQARGAFQAARAVYEDVLALDPRHRHEVDDVEDALARLDRSIDRLDDAPLRAAIDAERRARESDATLATLEALAEAKHRYEIVLELESDAEGRRFAGDHDRIREQREEVVDHLVETATERGEKAIEAGEWYRGAEQPKLARSEFETAIDVFERGIAVAESDRPGTLEELERCLRQASEQLSSIEPDPGDQSESAERGSGAGNDGTDPTGESEGDATAISDSSNDTIGTDVSGTTSEQRVNGTSTPDPREDERDHADTDEFVTTSLRTLSAPEFDRVATTVIEAMGWQPEPDESTPPDFVAHRQDGAGGTLAIYTIPATDDEPIDPETIGDCLEKSDTMTGVDEVMVVTTRPVPTAAMAVARNAEVCVLDAEYLSRALDGPATASGGGGGDPLIQ